MSVETMILPRPLEIREHHAGVICHLAKLNWIEADAIHAESVGVINRALERLDTPPLKHAVGKMNLGTRQRISLATDVSLEPEEYLLTISNESVTLSGGSPSGVFYGAQTLTQILAVSAEMGGHDRFLPVCIVRDKPRFPYRGFLLDSARHFQKVDVICALLDECAKYKLNTFHWHLVDRQSWRLPLSFAPELTRDVPRSRAYVFGAYTKEDIQTVCAYAKARHIRIVPELEMPGHSAAVFFSHPELACASSETPYEDDFWEFCLGNDKAREFLAKVLAEIAVLFPDSEYIHMGGDEASDVHWKSCPVCRKKRDELGLADERQLELWFMGEMEKAVTSLGKTAITWGIPHASGANFSDRMIIQNWLERTPDAYLERGLRLINSFHESNYFDYPQGDSESVEVHQKLCYEFDPCDDVPEEKTHLILGGEGCLWTEQIPAWRVLPRALPRIRALAEQLWSAGKNRDFEDFLRRERLLCGTGVFRYR